MYQGFTPQEETAFLAVLVKDADLAPADLDALPGFKVYGPDGMMPSGSGTGAYMHAGAVSAASNTTPITVTAAAHGLSAGQRVTVSGVLGNTGANGTFIVGTVTTDTFVLLSSVGNGSYVSGGTWHATGLYKLEVEALAADGYLAGITYAAVVYGTLAAEAWGYLTTFTVG